MKGACRLLVADTGQQKTGQLLNMLGLPLQVWCCALP